jgi:hypothetical protein
MTGADFHTDLVCPNCGKTAQVKNLVLKSARMHQCPKLRGRLTPMVREGVRAEIVINEREDYIGRTNVQLDPERGRPVMNMRTEYLDGHNDTIVYAPAATMHTRR